MAIEVSAEPRGTRSLWLQMLRGVGLFTLVALTVMAALVVGGLAWRAWQGGPAPVTIGLNYQPGSAMCAGPVTPECADRAAMRAGRPIVWVSTPSGFVASGAHLILIRGGESVFVQEMHDASTMADLQFGRTPQVVGGPDQAMTVDGVSVAVTHHFDYGSGEFEYSASWTTHGAVAAIRVSSSKQEGGSPDRAKAVLAELLANVHASGA